MTLWNLRMKELFLGKEEKKYFWCFLKIIPSNWRKNIQGVHFESTLWKNTFNLGVIL